MKIPTTSLLMALALSFTVFAQPQPVKDNPTAVPSSAAPDDAQLKREKRFSHLDANRDSFVDKEEFKKARFAQKKPARVEKRFAKADTNSDGKLSKDEWLATPARKSKAKTSA